MMYFHKYHAADNFKVTGDVKLSLEKLNGSSIYRLTAKSKRWTKNHSQAVLSPEKIKRDVKCSCSLSGKRLSLSINGKRFLESDASLPFGVSGNAWAMSFVYDNDMQFYGQGEKNNGFEKSGSFTKFWNTDVWGDFTPEQYKNGVTDPMYVSVPYLLIKRGNTYAGILVNDPYPVFMTLNAKLDWLPDGAKSGVVIGASDGVPDIYIIPGPTLDDVTTALQRLVGTTPRPPLWALGHQQCKWGYRSHDDLSAIAARYKKENIPNDGLWLDIDYMDGYRVFTYNKKHFAAPKQQIGKLTDAGGHVVPIIDPGVKREKGYAVYDDGMKNDVFCKTSDGEPYIGFVWPGATVFPDFSLPAARAWWAKQVKTFVDTGIHGAWIDMNDPSTGKSELADMRFNNGKLPHESYHNQYALGMAMATREGFLKSNPLARPLLVSRSGFISTSRYAAVWTGDNFSNFHHLKKSIEITLNLSLSGIPFNGPDVPGFGGTPTEELARKWYKAGFLFPFFRNHAILDAPHQEPWCFPTATKNVIAKFIKLRYKLLPYIYNLFIEQEHSGRPMLRPLMYDFADTVALPLSKVSDQFMAGDALMHAPVITEGAEKRDIVFPKGMWYDLSTGAWISGGRRRSYDSKQDATPLFAADGSIVMMQTGERTDNQNDLTDVEAHIFMRTAIHASVRYTIDDGSSFNYRRGGETHVDIVVKKNGTSLAVTIAKNGASLPVGISFIIHGAAAAISVNGGGNTTLRKGRVTLAGNPLAVKVYSRFMV
ncbi:MAG: hypothetical protein HZC28_20565 [Spirochaetes bacterium]|nr:hypothetical protein [Spirochaetota bacterium]